MKNSSLDNFKAKFNVGGDAQMSNEPAISQIFKVGEKFVTPGRTITEADIVVFAGLSGDWTELHTNAEYMKKASLDRE